MGPILTARPFSRLTRRSLAALLLFLLTLLAACAGNDEADTPEIAGPAFIFFYTDN
jgi:hypothetical protein